MKRLLLLMMAVVAIGFTSCSNDDGDGAQSNTATTTIKMIVNVPSEFVGSNITLSGTLLSRAQGGTLSISPNVLNSGIQELLITISHSKEAFGELEFIIEHEETQLLHYIWGNSTYRSNIHVNDFKTGFDNILEMQVNAPTLDILSISNTTLESITLNNCDLLRKLSCTYNNLSSLDVSKCLELEDITCNNNKISNLNIQYLTKLKTLQCSNNQLEILDVKHCKELGVLAFNNNNIKTIDISSNSIGFLGYATNPLEYINLGDYDWGAISGGTKELYFSTYDCNGLKSSKSLKIVSSNMLGLNINNTTVKSIDISECPLMGYGYIISEGTSLSEIWLKVGQEVPELLGSSNPEIRYKN